jgi:hypothetical protein
MLINYLRTVFKGDSIGQDDELANFYLMKNHQIAIIAPTNQGREI